MRETMTNDASRRRRRPSVGLGARATAALVAIFIAFGLCEIGVRALYPAPPEPAREPQIVYQTDPALGFVHVPNQVGFLDDGLATINALGLRGDLPEDPKPDGAVRVLAVGDSTTFGWGVGDRETYCAELERLLRHQFPERRIEVVNGGVAAYDLKRDYKLLERLAPRLKPDIVLVGLYWNDLPYEGVSPDGVRLAASTGIPAAVVPAAAGTTSPGTFRLGNQPSKWNRLLRSSRVLYTLRHAWLSAIAPTSAATNQVQWEMALLDGTQSPAIESAWADVKASLKQFRDLGAAQGFAVGVVTMPIRAQVEHEYPQAQYQTRVRAIADALGLFVVDPLPVFVQQLDRDQLFIPYDRIHFSALGNADLADAVFEAIRTRPEFEVPEQPVAGGGGPDGEVR
ncbi:MAG: hypothetical protein IT184_09985 [Acidobacteria bacterium]|nr:hypothetical protein [Acidobacteriota bacterium]